MARWMGSPRQSHNRRRQTREGPGPACAQTPFHVRGGTRRGKAQADAEELEDEWVAQQLETAGRTSGIACPGGSSWTLPSGTSLEREEEEEEEEEEEMVEEFTAQLLFMMTLFLSSSEGGTWFQGAYTEVIADHYSCSCCSSGACGVCKGLRMPVDFVSTLPRYRRSSLFQVATIGVSLRRSVPSVSRSVRIELGVLFYSGVESQLLLTSGTSRVDLSAQLSTSFMPSTGTYGCCG